MTRLFKYLFLALSLTCAVQPTKMWAIENRDMAFAATVVLLPCLGAMAGTIVGGYWGIRIFGPKSDVAEHDNGEEKAAATGTVSVARPLAAGWTFGGVLGFLCVMNVGMYLGGAAGAGLAFASVAAFHLIPT